MSYQIKDLEPEKAAIHSVLIEAIRSKLISDGTIIVKGATHKIDTNPSNIQLGFDLSKFYCPEIDNLGDIYTSPSFKVENRDGWIRVFLKRENGSQSQNLNIWASEVEMKYAGGNEFEVISLGNLGYNY